MKNFLVFLIAISSVSTFACDVNKFIQSENGQEILKELDRAYKLKLENFLEAKGMGREEYAVESKIPTSFNGFNTINPNGQYQWYHLKVKFPKGLITTQSGIIVKKEKRETLDAFNRPVESKCGVEITFDAGFLYSKRWNRTVLEKELVMRLPPMSEFIELQN